MSACAYGICAVIQACNEEKSIQNVLSQVLRAKIEYCVVVANGCADKTVEAVLHWPSNPNLSGKVISVDTALGPDVSRGFGALAALRSPWPVNWFVFLDGDWKGSFGPSLEDWLRRAVAAGNDVSYTIRPAASSAFRRARRQDWHIWDQTLMKIGSPLKDPGIAQAPMVVSRKTFQRVSPFWLYQPGLWFARCLTADPPLKIGVITGLGPSLVGNPTRSSNHQAKMLETLLGDAIEGSRILLGFPKERLWQGRERIGYHHLRRVDSLYEYMEHPALAFGVSVSHF